MIYFQAVREGYERFEISDIGFIRSEYNPADAFTKSKTSPVLEQILEQGISKHQIDQWIIRERSTMINYQRKKESEC